jgi:hypothetical protein
MRFLGHALGPSQSLWWRRDGHGMHPNPGSRVRHPPTFVPWGFDYEHDRMMIVPILSKRTTKGVEMKSEPAVPLRHRDCSTFERSYLVLLPGGRYSST